MQENALARCLLRLYLLIPVIITYLLFPRMRSEFYLAINITGTLTPIQNKTKGHFPESKPPDKAYV